MHVRAFSLDFLLHSGASGPLPGPRVGVGSLATHRKPAAVAKASIAAEVHQALNVHGDIAPEVTLNAVAVRDHLTDANDLLIAELLVGQVGIHLGLLTDLQSRRAADSIDVGQCDPRLLLAWEINSGNTWHRGYP